MSPVRQTRSCLGLPDPRVWFSKTMSVHWPLLVADPVDGDRLITRQLRPRAAAIPVDRTDFASAARAVVELCGTWGGGAMPLIPVTPRSEVDELWSRILMESNIDAIQRSEILSEDERAKYSDMHGHSTQLLLRIVVDLERKPAVQTCRGISTDDPWYLAYLAVLGDLSTMPDAMNTWNDLRPDLTYQDVLTIRSIEEDIGAAGLLACLRDYTATSAVDLTRVRLSSGLQASFNKGLLREESRFEWDDDRIARHYGPNIVVVYQPGSVEDLALIWNLRARFTHPPRFPLALPLTATTEQDLQTWVDSGADQRSVFGPNFALTSFSVDQADLATLGHSRQFDVIEPWQLLRPIYGYCVTSTEMAHFSHGKASVTSFSPTDIQALGQSYLGRHQGTWMKLKTTITEDPLPFCRTMRRGEFDEVKYLDGQISTGGEIGAFATIQQPAGLEALTALVADKRVRATVSAAGRAAEQLIRAAGPHLSMFASPGAATALTELTRGRNVSLVRKRLNRFLAEPDVDESSDRYQLLFDRLDKALGDPDPEEAEYVTFDRLKNLLKMSSPTAAQHWLQWAMSGRIILRGVEADCKQCGHKQWRPLREAVPVLTCHGCGQTIDNPHGFNHIDYRYRASEILLRAMSHDVLPCVLSMRYISEVMGGNDTVFGAYPGIDFRQPGSATVAGEADVVVALRKNGLILGECKARARGLNQEELDKLWAAADLVNARATFAATLDRAAGCGPELRVQWSPNERPHFALTAEHLFDLDCAGPTAAEDFFEWRDGYPPGRNSDPQDREELVDKEFNDYVERTGTDYEQWHRAPWMTDQ